MVAPANDQGQRK